MGTEIKRETWADKAKFIGIVLMLLGHNALANKAVFDFIYSFHMPLFFILSGYFANNKKEPLKDYVLKNIKGLLLPYVFFYILTLPFGYFVIYAHPYNHPYDGWIDFICKPLIGLFTVETTPFAFHTNGPSWFFVALFWVKLIFYISKKYNCSCWSLVLTSVISLCLLGGVKILDINLYARIDAALLAYPLYVFGYIFHKYVSYIDHIQIITLKKKIVLVVLIFLLCYSFGVMNGHVEFSAAHYGENVLLMYLSAILGTMGVVTLSCILPDNKYLLIIGEGTAVVLGLHSPIQQLVKEVVKLIFNLPTHDYSLIIALLMVLVVTIIHIPIILFLNTKCPYLMGRSKKIYNYENNSHSSWESKSH